MRPTSVTVSATGNSNWIPVDYTQNNFNLGIQVVVSDGASLTWVVQLTSDDVFDPDVTPTAITAPDPLNTGTGNEIGSITTPVRAVRLNATVTSGTATMTVIQGRKVGATGGTLVTWNDDATALLKPDGTELALTTARVFTIGSGGQYATLADLIAAEGTGISAGAQATAYFLPGTHNIPGLQEVPAGLHLRGAERTITTLLASNNYSTLRFSGGFPHQISDFRIVATRTAAASSTGIFIIQTAPSNVLIEHVDMILNGGYNAAIHCSWFSTVSMRDVNIYTSSIGLRTTGYWRLTDCNIYLHDVGGGITTTTPKIGIRPADGSSSPLRVYMTGGFIGTGYNTYWDSALVTPELTGASRSTTEVIGIWVPATHTAPIGSGTRFQMRGTEVYTRNDAMTDFAVRNHCILVEGYARVRLFGGVYQSEAPAMVTEPALAVRNLAEAATSSVESYGARITFGYEGISAGLGLAPTRRITASLALNQSNACGVIMADATAGAITVTLPSASATYGPGNGTDITVIKIDSSANAVTVQRANAATSIEGAASVSLAAQYDKCKVVYDPVAKVYVRLI